MEAAGVELDWLAGSSIGSSTGAALVAGNPPGHCTAARALAPQRIAGRIRFLGA